jgi:hypothetical protein
MLTSGLALCALFTTKVVLLKAPLDFDAYVIHETDYVDGTVIGGIPWNPHFTDLRVWIKNPTAEDYSDVSLDIVPYYSNYRAAIVGNQYGCRLDSIGERMFYIRAGERERKGEKGATLTLHEEGNQYQALDDEGHRGETFLRDGYRLVCENKFPAHSSIQILFALAIIDSKYVTPGMRSGRRGADVITTDIFDQLGQVPPVPLITINGHYKLGPKPISIEQKTIPVGVGN